MGPLETFSLNVLNTSKASPATTVHGLMELISGTSVVKLASMFITVLYQMFQAHKQMMTKVKLKALRPSTFQTDAMESTTLTMSALSM